MDTVPTRRAGVGLKPEHVEEVLGTRPGLGFFELHAENLMVPGGPVPRQVARVRERYPLSLHGVGLSIGGEAPLDGAHLARLAALVERFEPTLFSEHLAWSSHGGVFFNDLLPLPYTSATLRRVCDHVDRVQRRLKRPMLLENPATYLAFESSTWDEPSFIAEVVARTGCGLLLDVNNVHVSCTNHGRDARAYVDALPLHAVGEVHLAGHAHDRGSAGGPLLIDSHDRAVDEVVWQLYHDVVDRIGPKPTLIERDADLPPLADLLAEAHRADAVMAAACRAEPALAGAVA